MEKRKLLDSELLIYTPFDVICKCNSFDGLILYKYTNYLDCGGIFSLTSRNSNGDFKYEIKNIKPYLYSVDMIDKEIESPFNNNGSPFCPLRVLIEGHLSDTGILDFGRNFKLLELTTSTIDFTYEDDYSDGTNYDSIHLTYDVLVKLASWHIDIFDLIPDGLAIDKQKMNE